MSSYQLNTHIQALLKYLPSIASLCVISLACLTLIGWVLDVPVLASVVPGGRQMSPTSMIGFLFAGAALALLETPPASRRFQLLARAFALVVLVTGLAATIDILTGVMPDVEQRFFAWLFAYPRVSDIKAASPQASLSFLFLGAALLLLDTASARARLQAYVSACVVLLINALSLLGHGFGARALYEMTPERGIALNTACALILLSLAVLGARADARLMSVITSQNVSGQVARRLLVAAVVVPLLLAMVAIVGERVGRYDSAFGAALLIILNIAIFVALIWRSVELLHQVETERQQSELALQQAYQSLEQRVNERTAQLAVANEELKREIAGRERVERERAQLLVSEQSARAQAESDSRLKDEFLNTVSHELRAPLNTVRGWVALLRAGDLNGKETDKALEMVERGARELDQKVNDLLDVSRLVNGRMHLQIRSVELATVIDAAVEAARPAANAKGIELQTMLDADEASVWGDANRLQQAVWNLLSNSIKFTPRGGRVTTQLTREGGHVEIAVRDTGVGISADVLPYVFDHFRQADGSRTRGQRGLGVGLTIVRHLVEMHGGSIRVESAGEGRGTSSVIRLPVIENQWSLPGMAIAENYSEHSASANLAPENSASQLRAPRNCAPSLAALRVLVVDGDDNSRRLIADTLADCRAVVRVAGSVEESLSVLADWMPDLVILDMGLHSGEDDELTDRLGKLASRGEAEIPVVALTGYARVEDRLRALRAGFRMQVPRPVEPAEVLAVVAREAERVASHHQYA